MIPTFSPQGDGNACSLYHMISLRSLIPTFSPQGDGNFCARRISATLTDITVDPYLFPARGRKHCLLDDTVEFATSVDPYLFPARGRKLARGLAFRFCLNDVDPYLFPARGRKLEQLIGGPNKATLGLIPTFSPQGDGNAAFLTLRLNRCRRVDPYLFPARGRKRRFRVLGA